MSNLLAILTEATCGFSCWYAEQEMCRCSCGGRNHGILLDPDNPQPERIVKIDGFTYRLEAVDKHTVLYRAMKNMLGKLGWAKIDSRITHLDRSSFHYGYYEPDKGSPFKLNRVTSRQYTWPDALASLPEGCQQPKGYAKHRTPLRLDGTCPGCDRYGMY